MIMIIICILSFGFKRQLPTSPQSSQGVFNIFVKNYKVPVFNGLLPDLRHIENWLWRGDFPPRPGTIRPAFSQSSIKPT